MPLTPNFTATSILGSPSTIVFTDTSTGSDSNVTERRIYLRTYNGSYLVPDGATTDYIVWPLATNPFYLDILPVDMAFDITVVWEGIQADFLLINSSDILLIDSSDKLLL